MSAIGDRLAVLVMVLGVGLAPLGTRAGEISVDAGRGPVSVQVPSGYQPTIPAPLLILLHGYTSSGAETEAVLQFAPEADARGMIYAFPDGTEDAFGNRFWNATDACCNFFGSTVDDVAYLSDLIDVIAMSLNVDPARIFVAGHSNGGFMAYQFACEQADSVAAIVSVAGATFDDPADCVPSRPVRTLQIHGTADGTILFDGGFLLGGGFYPSAQTTTETWAAYNGCDMVATVDPVPLDLDASIAGDETTVMRYETNCDAGAGAQPATSSLWTIAGGAHVPTISATFTGHVADFLLGPEAPPIFADGFESGSTNAWSATDP